MNKYEQKPEFILDLHGLTVKEAKVILESLIAKREYDHIRMITGKGLYRDSGPVLRTFVENFLQDREIQFSRAKLYNGGEGALEVFLSIK